jgi:hypothetical protein
MYDYTVLELMRQRAEQTQRLADRAQLVREVKARARRASRTER